MHFFVLRRQRVVLNTAVKSHQIVSSLFPAVVRNRLFGDETGGHSTVHAGTDASVGSSRPQTNKMRVKNFLETDNGEGIRRKDSTLDGGAKSRPIADLFVRYYSNVTF